MELFVTMALKWQGDNDDTTETSASMKMTPADPNVTAEDVFNEALNLIKEKEGIPDGMRVIVTHWTFYPNVPVLELMGDDD